MDDETEPPAPEGTEAAPPRAARERTPARTQIISRMIRLLARQLDEMEKNMTTTGDKEVALLGNMAKNLEKLLQIERAQRGTTAATRPRKDIAALRTKLAKRIDELRQA